MKAVKLTNEELCSMKKRREELDFTQAYMAEKLCLSETAYQKYEKGKRDIPKDVLSTINQILDLSLMPTPKILPEVRAFSTEKFVSIFRNQENGRFVPF